MICPNCQSGDARRSHRRTMLDFALSLVGTNPWRCARCEKRFYARSVKLRNVRYARCGICGNLELKKIAPEYVPGAWAVVARMMGLPALRCEPCRHKFFALRPVLKVAPRYSASTRDQAA